MDSSKVKKGRLEGLAPLAAAAAAVCRSYMHHKSLKTSNRLRPQQWQGSPLEPLGPWEPSMASAHPVR